MNISTELYSLSLARLPKSGQYIIGHQNDHMIVVYQAYKPSIADYSVKNQLLGGEDFSFSRMSWIKLNFLWMMYRCGWAAKENQERVLAIWIEKSDFEALLKEGVYSSFNQKQYASHEQWKYELSTKQVRLQWDPDHDPYGNHMERRAIQLGLKGAVLRKFATRQIKQIEDVTDFVKQQKLLLDSKKLDQLCVPIETVFNIRDEAEIERLGIS